MKLKKEYIILLLIIVVLVLYIALRKDSRIQYEIPEVNELAAESISGIVIQGNNSEIRLTKENDKWLLGEEKYIADAYKVEKMIEFLKKPVLVTVVSDSKDYMRYGLDEENRIIVKALSGENPQRVVDIGYQADIRNHTFIKLENDDRVFHAKEDLRDIFSTNIDDIRDKTVLSFDNDMVDSVQITKDGKELAINKKEMPSEGEETKDTTYQWATHDGETVEASLIGSLINDISQIKCSGYIYDTKEDEPGNPEYIIKVKDKNEHVLTVYPKKEDDYAAVSSDNPTPFKLYSWRIDNILKKFDEIFGKEDKKETEAD